MALWVIFHRAGGSPTRGRSKWQREVQKVTRAGVWQSSSLDGVSPDCCLGSEMCPWRSTVGALHLQLSACIGWVSQPPQGARVSTLREQ